MERINVRVDQRLKQELEAEAREKGVRPSVIVRQVLEEHIRSRAQRRIASNSLNAFVYWLGKRTTGRPQ